MGTFDRNISECVVYIDFAVRTETQCAYSFDHPENTRYSSLFLFFFLPLCLLSSSQLPFLYLSTFLSISFLFKFIGKLLGREYSQFDSYRRLPSLYPSVRSLRPPCFHKFRVLFNPLSIAMLSLPPRIL